MKRFTYVFILLYSFILTLGAFNTFNERYFERLQFLAYEYKEQHSNESLVLNLYLKENGLSEIDAMNRLQDLARENNLEVLVSLENKDIIGRNVKSTYIYSKNFNFDEYGYLENHSTIDFSDEHQSGYISTDPMDEVKNHGIRFLSTKYTRGKGYPVLRFLPMHSFVEYNEASVNFFAPTLIYDEQEISKNDLIEKVIDKYPFISPMEIYESEQFTEDIEKEAASLTDYLAPIMLLIILLTATSHVNANLKEVSVRKLQGNSSKTIFIRIMMSFILISILFYFVGTLISYFLLGGDFSSISMNIVRPVLRNIITFIFILIIFMILTYGYIYYIGNFVALKRNKSRMSTVYINLLLKMLLIILVLAPLVQEIQSGANALQRIYYYTKASEEYKGKYMVYLATSSGFSVDSQEDQDSDFQRILFEEFIRKDKGFYADFTLTYWPPDAVVGFVAGGLDVPYPSITADYNYMRQYIIRDEEGQVVDLSSIQENTVLVPMKLKDIQHQTYNQITHSVPKVMYVSFDRHFMNPDVGSGNLLVEDPVVNYVVEYIQGINVSYTSAFYSSESDLQKKLDQSGFSDLYLIEEYKPIFEFYMNGYRETLFEATFFLMIFSIIPLIFLYQSLSFHLSEKKKEISLRYSMGSGFLRRYKEIILLHLLPYGVLVLTVGTILKISEAIGMYLVLYYIFIDVIFMIFILKKFERKSVSEVLKGE